MNSLEKAVSAQKNPFQKFLKKFYADNKKVINTLFMIALVFIGGELFLTMFMDFSSGAFLSTRRIFLTVRLSAFIALFGLSQMVVISVGGGGLDLSVGWTATLAAVLSSRVMDGQDSNLLLAVLVCILIGAAVGFLNGLLIAYAGLPPLVVTMAMASIVQGINNAYVSTYFIRGTAAPALRWIVSRFTGIFPNVVSIVLVAVVIMHIIINYTQIGVRMLGVGSNDITAYLSGVNVRVVRCCAYVASGIIAALVGMVLVGSAGQAFMDMGSMYVLPSVVAVVIGGMSIAGGEGNYLAVVLGAVLLQTLTNLFVALGWGDAGKWVGYGVILLVMLIIYVRNKRSR